jgi:hypothetical protein
MTEAEKGMTVEEKKLGEEARFCCIKRGTGPEEIILVGR